jgi:hypothetical protein
MLATTSRIVLGAQSTKGTPAEDALFVFRANQSAVNPRFDMQDNVNYHEGIHQRGSSQRARPARTSAVQTFSAGFLVWPTALPVAFLGLGFVDDPTDNTTYYSHALTKADVDAALYLTALHAIGEDSARFERRLTDLRLTSLEIAGSPGVLTATISGLALTEDAALGTETITTETAGPLIPGTGSLAWGSSLALGEPRAHTVTFERPVDEQDQKMHSFTRADLPETGFSVRGTMTGLDMSYGTYKKLAWGGTSGTGPDDAIVTASLTFSYESANDMAGGSSLPYGLTIAVATAEIRLTDFEARDNNIVRCNAQWTMIDEASGAPVTVTVNNLTASYEPS